MASTVVKNKKKLSKRVTAAIITVFLWAFAAFWFAPIFWMLSTSMKSTTLAVIETPPQWIPNNPTLENYKIIFAPSGGLSLIKATLNSVIVAVSATLATLMLSVPAAYALSRLRFRGRMFIFWMYVAVLAFPAVLFLIPHFFIINGMGLTNSYLALILPGLGGTFGVFLLRQYMLDIPKELEDAAWIDGCSKFRFLISIVIPYIKPAMLVLSLMTFLGSWNSFLWPLLILSKADKFTLPIALIRFSAGWGDPYRGIGPMMAGAFFSVAPSLIIFIAFHRYLMKGISLGSLGKE